MTPLVHFKNLPLEKARDAVAGSFDEMANISRTVRRKLAGAFTIDKLETALSLVSRNKDAVKFGFKLSDSPYLVESVLLIDGDRRTACLSSQLGCGLGCTFCETGRLGFIRNLTLEEMSGQLIGINDWLAAHREKLVTNVVFMGMGEALSNFDNFRSTLEIIMHNDCFAIGGRRITVSTAGVVPSIERLMHEDLNVGLAISLNEYSNRRRDAVMPVNRKYPIESLVEIAGRYFRKTGRRVTFEYVVAAGETDTPQAAVALKQLLSGITCKINLIPVNPTSGSNGVPPSRRRLMEFADRLHEAGIAATIRTSRGVDICGACGQLAAKRYI
jgi:23S rRNA (adenine2503-C2)-methyltransferase